MESPELDARACARETRPMTSLDLTPWPQLEAHDARPLTGGLINATWAVGSPPVGVVQRLSPIFGPEVHHDIAAVVAHLDARGVCTPRLIPTGSGLSYHLDSEGACWRALTWIPGVSHQRLTDPAQAAAAARFVARWHRSLENLQHEFVHVRVGVHDTSAHMTRLAGTLVTGFDHRLFPDVERVGAEILGAWANWEGPQDLPLRIAHGDLKVSNVRFDAAGQAVALVDLDTLGRMPIDAELGDAWRSWCNRATEDSLEAQLDLEIFEAAATAYLEENPLPPEERQALPGGIERISLELAARFAVDAIEESYFGWSAQIAPTRGEHNLLRARGQLSLAIAVRGLRDKMDAVVR